MTHFEKREIDYARNLVNTAKPYMKYESEGMKIIERVEKILFALCNEGMLTNFPMNNVKI